MMPTRPAQPDAAAPTAPAPWFRHVQAWIDQARTQLNEGHAITPEALDALQAVIDKPAQVRQRLLYMHLTTPVPSAQAISCVIFEPDGGGNEISAEEPVLAYPSVVAAIADGWQVLSLPDINAPIDDHEVDMIGYLFVLQKLEVFHD